MKLRKYNNITMFQKKKKKKEENRKKRSSLKPQSAKIVTTFLIIGIKKARTVRFDIPFD